MYLMMYILFLSSSYLCVFGDDHVTRYMEADVDACGAHGYLELEWDQHESFYIEILLWIYELFL